MMLAYAARRLLIGTFVSFAVIFSVFVLTYGIGDPAAATLGPNANAEAIQTLRKQHGLHKPLLQQFGSYMGLIPCVRESSPAYDDGAGFCGLFQGDMAESMGHREPVAGVLSHRLPRTLMLGIIAILIELFIGLGVGVLAAVKRNTWIDTGAMSSAFLGISLPTYVTGPIFVIVFGFLYGWFPIGGYGRDFGDHLYHAVLPATTLAIFGAATYARLMRSEMIDSLRSDYVRTARAKGLSRRQVIMGHAARNSLLPIVTLIGLSLPLLVSGAIITEQVFNWPGMGLLAIRSIENLDSPTIMGVVVVFTVVVQIGNLIADLAVAALDPRVRLQSR